MNSSSNLILLLFIIPIIDIAYLYLRLNNTIKLQAESLSINIGWSIFELVLNLSVSLSGVYLLIEDFTIIFCFYYFLVFFYMLCVMLLHYYSNISSLIRDPMICLKEDLDMADDPLPLFYAIIAALLWPITRFVFIKPIYTTINIEN